MKDAVYTDTLVMQRRRMVQQWLMMILLGISVLLLSVTVLLRHERIRTVVVPMHASSPFWVEDEHVSEAYLIDMADYVMTQYLTVTPGNLSHHNEKLLTLAAPEAEGALSQALSIDAKKIKREHLNVVFYPKQITADPDALQADVTGDVLRFTAQHQLPRQRVTYRVRFKLNRGQLWLIGIDEKGGQTNETT